MRKTDRNCYYARLIVMLSTIIYYKYYQLYTNTNNNNNNNGSSVHGQILTSSIGQLEPNLTISYSSRKKRFAIFPEGTTFTVAMCVTLKLMTPDYDIFTEAVNWALTYDLPSSPNDYYRRVGGKPLPINVTKRSVGRFYRILEMLFKEYDVDGKACVLRMLCESQRLLSSKQTGFIQILLKIILRYKTAFENAMDIDSNDYSLYRASCDTNHRGPSPNCKQIFSSCPISFLHLILSV